MSDQGETIQLWELHFHRTMTIAGGTQEIDVFTLRLRDPKAAFLTFTVPHSKEGMDLVHQVCMRMNQDDRTTLLNPIQLATVEAAFHGPWLHNVAIGRHLIVTEAEVLTISRFIYREVAIRTSIEGQFRCLFEDHQKLVKLAAAMEQELLRLHHQQGDRETHAVTVSDLLTPNTDETQLEMVDMACRKPIVCRLDEPQPTQRRMRHER